MADPEHSQPTVTELILRLRDELTTLVRQEVALARTEVAEIGARLGRNLALLAAAAVVAGAGALLLLAALTFGVDALLVAVGVSDAVAAWLAPLLVGAVVLAVAMLLLRRALAGLKREPLRPRRTIESFQETRQWMNDRS